MTAAALDAARETRARQTCADASDVERVTGIEPAPSVWKTEALPLSYTRTSDISRVGGY